MRRISIGPALALALFVAILPLVGKAQTPQDVTEPLPSIVESDDLEPWEIDKPVLHLHAGALWLTRSSDEKFVVGRVVGFNPGPPAVFGPDLAVRTTGALEFDWRPGMKLYGELDVTDATSVEVGYFGLNEWTQYRSLQTSSQTQPIFSPWLQFGIIPAAVGVTASQDYFWGSRLDQTEINVKRTLVDRRERIFKALAGFRYLSIQEHFRVFEEFTSPTPQGGDNEKTTDYTSNNLVGGQAGFDWVEFLGPIEVGLLTKAGVFGNFAKTHFANAQGVNAPNGGNAIPFFNGSAHDETVSVVVELGGSIAYPMGKHFMLRGGYNVFFMTNLALAPNQLEANLGNRLNSANFTGQAAIDTGSFVVYHGPSIGLDIHW